MSAANENTCVPMEIDTPMPSQISSPETKLDSGKSAPVASMAAPVAPVASIAPVAPVASIAPVAPVAPISPRFTLTSFRTALSQHLQSLTSTDYYFMFTCAVLTTYLFGLYIYSPATTSIIPPPLPPLPLALPAPEEPSFWTSLYDHWLLYMNKHPNVRAVLCICVTILGILFLCDVFDEPAPFIGTPRSRSLEYAQKRFSSIHGKDNLPLIKTTSVSSIDTTRVLDYLSNLFNFPRALKIQLDDYGFIVDTHRGRSKAECIIGVGDVPEERGDLTVCSMVRIAERLQQFQNENHIFQMTISLDAGTRFGNTIEDIQSALDAMTPINFQRFQDGNILKYARVVFHNNYHVKEDVVIERSDSGQIQEVRVKVCQNFDATLWIHECLKPVPKWYHAFQFW